jgi:hypothetical protein
MCSSLGSTNKGEEMTETQKAAMKTAFIALRMTHSEVVDSGLRHVMSTAIERLQTALLELSPSDVRITKAADQHSVWYVTPAGLGKVFKMPHSTACRFQLQFHVSSVDEVFSALLAGGYMIVDDPMYQSGEPKFTGEIADTLRCWKATRINGTSASLASDGDVNIPLIKAFDQISAWAKGGAK